MLALGVNTLIGLLNKWMNAQFDLLEATGHGSALKSEEIS